LKFLLLTLFLLVNVSAQEDYSLRVAYGKATASDLSEILSGDIRPTYDNTGKSQDYEVLAIDAGYLYDKGTYIDTFFKAGLAYYKQHILEDTFEAALYFKLYYNMDMFSNRVRFGFGEGLSYTNGYLEPEYDEAVQDEDNHSRYLNYLDISLDLDLGRLVRVRSLYDTYIGFAIKHRSGIFGLINNVKEGGANYNTFYIEKNF